MSHFPSVGAAIMETATAFALVGQKLDHIAHEHGVDSRDYRLACMLIMDTGKALADYVTSPDETRSDVPLYTCVQAMVSLGRAMNGEERSAAAEQDTGRTQAIEEVH